MCYSWAVAAALCVDRLGRRFLFLASSVIMLVSFIVVTGLSGSFAQTGSSSVGLAVIPFLFLFFGGYDIALTPLLIGADEPGREILHPVAVTIFGGLLSATILDSMVTPILFLMFGSKPLDRLLAGHAATLTPAEAY